MQIDDKNPIYMPWKYLPQPHGRVRPKRYSCRPPIPLSRDFRRFSRHQHRRDRQSGSPWDPEKKICRLLDFTDAPGDIADPWYTGDFETTYKDVVKGCQALLAKLVPSGPASQTERQ